MSDNPYEQMPAWFWRVVGIGLVLAALLFVYLSSVNVSSFPTWAFAGIGGFCLIYGLLLAVRGKPR